MNQAELLAYAQQHLPNELRRMQTGAHAKEYPNASAAGKAVIYHHTDDGFEVLNAALYANSATMPLAGQALQAALAELLPHSGIVYSGVRLDAAQLAALKLALAHADGPQPIYLDWPAFLSASKSRLVAELYRSGKQRNCLLLIESKTGRAVEGVSRYGSSEREVLFLPGTRFRVTGLLPAVGYTEVVLAEL